MPRKRHKPEEIVAKLVQLDGCVHVLGDSLFREAADLVEVAAPQDARTTAEGGRVVMIAPRLLDMMKARLLVPY
jgi:hypothetical protein